MKLSDIYGKEVESKDKKRRGWVRSVLGKGGAPQFLQCFDGEEREFDVDWKDIVHIGDKIIFDDRAAEKKNCSPLRLGLPAYDDTGRFLGNLSDISVGKEGVFYVIGRKKYRPEYISVGDVLIVHPPRTLKENVTAGGAVILKKGSPLTPEALKKAEEAGEYFQAWLKRIWIVSRFPHAGAAHLLYKKFFSEKARKQGGAQNLRARLPYTHFLCLYVVLCHKF